MAMAVTEPCRECGVLDALGRHAGDCPRALEMGLPRLADGEDPIDPIEEASYDRQIAQERAAEPEHDPLLKVARDQGAVRDIRDVLTNPDAELTDLWMAYQDASDERDFNAVIFGTELEALRHAVNAHWRVIPLELGRSLLDLVRAADGPT